MQIVLCKSGNKAHDKYINKLKQNGYENCTILDPLSCTYCNLDLAEKALRDNNDDGLILTSTKAVQVLFKYHDLLESRGWLQKPCLAVGPATADMLSEGKFTNIWGGKDAGNAISLMKVLEEKLASTTARRFLFFCGDPHSPEIQNYFQRTQNALVLRSITVYKAALNPQFEAELLPLLHASQNTVIVGLFSPMVASLVAKLVLAQKSPTTLCFVCIGPTTFQSLGSGFPFQTLVCSSPTPEDFVHCLKNFLQ